MKTLIIDDERDFLDGRECDVARSSYEAIELFSNDDGVNNGVSYDEVWLDFSLSGSDSIMDFVFFASRSAAQGNPLRVGNFVIHTSTWDGASLIKHVLDGAGYTNSRFDIASQGSPKIIGIRTSQES